ncbi:hypothetical protein BGZ63DRAFT_380076 [Mariannaea sp. PMI_226]|nr:hypothetical protein BGZ63DRAFT_380076 [Mariannaea sp. PMI_226]
MTPVNLTLFLVSLLVVELRYSLQRAENAHGRDGRAPWKWLPPWLRRLALSVTQQPYGPSDDHDDEGRWHYHSKQRKLMKMEAEEAFQMQGHILVILVMLMAVTLGFFYLVVSRAYHGVRHLIAAQRVH